MAKKKIKIKKNNMISRARIKVAGVGGAGGNAISRMAKTFPKSINFLAINTDLQDLNYAKVKKKICIGRDLTRGLGTGMKPELGRKAAEEAKSEISRALKETDLLFITAGLGGGTGTGAGPVVADVARELGILTIAVVTRPFGFEGMERNHIADEGFVRLKEKVDAIIAIPNDRIFSLIDKETSLAKAFEKIDEVLKNAIEGVSEIIMTPGIINVDFADIKAIIENAGLAVIGVGRANGKDRAINSANMASSSPLLEIPIDGARGLLFSVSSNRDLKMEEVNEIAKLISLSVDPNAKIIFGTYRNKNLKKGEVKTIIVATGFTDHLIKPVLPQTDLFIQSKEVFPEEIKEEEKTLALKLPKQKILPIDRQVKKKREEIRDKEEFWEIPAFLRKKKKK